MKLAKKYPVLSKFTEKLTLPKRKIFGREQEVENITSVLLSPEYANPVLVGEAGVGKTEVVREFSQFIHDEHNLQTPLARKRLLNAQVRSVDTQALVALDNSGSDKVGYRLQALFKEVSEFYQNEGIQLILFIDEFHLLKTLSSTALQALKPALANSGAMHVMFIAATTLEEYDEYIRDDHALEERLVREDIRPLTDDVVLKALRNFCKVYAPDSVISDALLKQVIDLSNRFVPSEVQPRKSIKIIDGLIGRHNMSGAPYDMNLLNKTVMQRTGINTEWQVNPRKLSQALNNKVFGQQFAVRAVLDYLMIAIAGINDTSRPLGSFLFTGPTGVGKTELAKQLAINLLGSEDAMIRFDMSEYSKDNRQGGADMFRERLTQEVYKRPSSIILLDEIEKARTEVVQLLLQVLDDARLTDIHGRETTFKNCYIIATSNSASEVFAGIMKNEGEAMYNEESASRILRDYESEIKKNLISGAGRDGRTEFPTELVNRFDSIVPFLPLTNDVKEKIVELQLDSLAEDVKGKFGVQIKYDNASINAWSPDSPVDGHNRLIWYLASSNGETANDQYSTDAGGGRKIKRKIDQQLRSQVADVLITSETMPDVIGVKVEGNLEEEIQHERGSAHIVVGPYEPKGLDQVNEEDGDLFE